MSRRNDTADEYEVTEIPSTRRRESEPLELGSRQSRTRRRRWPLLLAVLAAVLFFLPNMIGWFGFHRHLVDYALADFNGNISLENASLGWLQKVCLTNVTATDSNGNTLLQAEAVKSSKPLYALIMSPNYGQIDVTGANCFLQLRPDGSNLEDALANFMGRSDTDSTPGDNDAALPKLTVNVVEGQADISSTTSTQGWQVGGLNATIQVGTDKAPLLVNARCRVTPTKLDDSGQTIQLNSGELSFASQVDAGQSVLNFSSADLLLETEEMPLSLAAPVIQRFVGPVNTTGTMNGKIQAAYSANTVSIEVQQIGLDGFGFVAPELIGSDQILIDQISANGILQISPSIIAAQQFQIQSDIAEIRAEGSFDIEQLTSLATGGQLLDTPFQLDGQIDLAKLTRMLPSTLQLHKDLIINSGTATFQAGSQNENGTKRMVINLDTANINARRGAQQISWAKPLRLVGTIQQSQGQLALNDIRCISDFLTIAGNADLKTGSFVAQGDLDQLIQRVGQFADLGGAKLAGVLEAKFGWQVDNSGNQPDPGQGDRTLPVQIGGSIDIINPVIEMPGMQPWNQPRMSVKLTAAGKSHAGTRLQIDQGGIQVDAGSEQMFARLAQPVPDAFANQVWNADCQLSGSMSGWLMHLENFVELGDVVIEGQLVLNCGATIDGQSVQLSNVQYSIDQLVFDGYGMKIREAKTVGAGTAIYDLATGNISIPDTTFSGSAISARGQQLQIKFPGNIQIDGDILFRGDVNRIAAWYAISPTPDSIFWYGGIDGTVKLASNENGIRGQLNSKINNLVAARQVDVPNPVRRMRPGQAIPASQPKRQWLEVWRESEVSMSGGVALANDFNAIRIQNLLINSPSLQVKADGSIVDLAGSMITDISGTWRPSWEKINGLLHAYAGGLMKFAGQAEQQFVIRGPIYETKTQPGITPWVSPSFQAAASVGWERGEILGLAVGQSKIDLLVAQSIANLKTNGIPFAGGVVQLAPQIDLRSESPILTMDRTRIIDNVALQPETARQWLKYVAPLVADATSAKGNFTVDVESAAVPLHDPMNMEIQGTATLTNVVIGAGPMAEQLLGTVNQLRALLKPNSNGRDYNTWLQMSEQTVPVIVKNGRVFHDNVKLAHRDLILQTRGSIGFDQTLKITAEIMIADDWIAGKPYLAGLRGKSISIPIGGTISKPLLDIRALHQLSRDLIQQAAGGLVNEKVIQERDKLMKKFGESLGLPNDAVAPKSGTPQPGQALPGQPSANPPTLEQQLQNKAQDELFKGIGKLFGK